MPPPPPSDPADHAENFARRWADRLDEYCTSRMAGLGVPDAVNGEPDPSRPGQWQAFVAGERTGGYTSRGVTINSGVLNPGLLKGGGSRLWPKARLRDRIDAVIAHEWTETQTLDHDRALKAAPRTELPISEAARRILRAMAR